MVVAVVVAEGYEDRDLWHVRAKEALDVCVHFFQEGIIVGCKVPGKSFRQRKLSNSMANHVTIQGNKV